MNHEGRSQLRGDAAEFYERYVKFVMEPWVRRLADVAALQPAEHVLDVACGTGLSRALPPSVSARRGEWSVSI